MASTTGGFVQQYNGSTEVAVTSRHNVWGLMGESGYTIDEASKVYQIPGGSGFVCASCHDPHGGGATPDGSGLITGSAGSPNPRLLRRSITVIDSAYTDLYVSLKMATVGTFTYNGVNSGVYQVTGYQSGTVRWCGGCHNKFQVNDNDARPMHSTAGPGHAVYAYGMHRHPVNVPHAYLLSGADSSVVTGTPLENSRGVAGSGCIMCHPTHGTPPGDYFGNLGCLTYHRAHSTTATKASWASSWPRDSGIGGTSNTSALLRMNNRGIWYNCHGTGQYNCWNDTRFDGIENSDGVPDCDLCHSV